MAEVFQRVCTQDYIVEAQNGDRLELRRGKTYTISAPQEGGNVIVFTNFWVPVPEYLFVMERRK